MGRKFIIDTDIGDDIDDAFAIFLAMRLKLNILGITTVFKNVSQRSRMVKKLLKCYANGYDNVPVYSGYGQTMENSACVDKPIVQYTTDLEFPDYVPDSEDPESAIDFIINSCEKYGEDLTIVAIGPFTNIAKAIEKCPTAFAKCKVVIMGGAYFRQYADWNVMCDTIAADILYRNIPRLSCLGADVTHQLNIGQENTDKILNYVGKNKALLYIKELFAMWTEACGTTPWLHDPLAVYYATDENICEIKSAPIAVITEGLAKGVTLNLNEYRKTGMNPAYADFNYSKRVNVAFSVKRQKMIDVFMNAMFAE